MKLYDNLVTYSLMTMHPLMHITLLTTGGILVSTNYENFYQIDGTCPEGTEAQAFVLGGKHNLMNLALFGHAVCIVCHYLYQILNHYDIKVIANIFLFVKMMIFFVITLKIQSSIDFTECSQVTDDSMVMAWLTYEVLAYYLNIVSLGVFIFIQNFKKFRSIRDRIGLAGNARKTMDFMNYAKDDVHWWSIWFTQLSLCVLALIFRNNTTIDIKWSVIEVFTKHFLGAFLVRQLYFNSKFQFKLNTRVVLGLTVVVNVFLIFRYIQLKQTQSNWWTPVVLNDIILYFVIFGQMGIEYLSWGNRQLKWRQDLMFDQQFVSNADQSERHIRSNINSIIDQINYEGLDAVEDEDKIKEKLPVYEDQSIKQNKEMKVSANMYTAAYFALMKKNKKELKMTSSDQYDVLFKAFFVMSVQVAYIYVVLSYGQIKWMLFNQTHLQVIMIFTSLLLHLTWIPNARTGLFMMKYVVCHPEDFVNPHMAFFLGFIQFTFMWFTEIINIMKASQKKTPFELMCGYIGYKVIMDIPSIWYGSLNSPIKSKVGKLVSKRSRKEPRGDGEGMAFHGVYNFIYVAHKMFYNSVYFYFFAYTSCLIPFINILIKKETQDF